MENNESTQNMNLRAIRLRALIQSTLKEMEKDVHNRLVTNRVDSGQRLQLLGIDMGDLGGTLPVNVSPDAGCSESRVVADEKETDHESHVESNEVRLLKSENTHLKGKTSKLLQTLQTCENSISVQQSQLHKANECITDLKARLSQYKESYAGGQELLQQTVSELSAIEKSFAQLQSKVAEYRTDLLGANEARQAAIIKQAELEEVSKLQKQLLARRDLIIGELHERLSNAAVEIRLLKNSNVMSRDELKTSIDEQKRQQSRYEIMNRQNESLINAATVLRRQLTQRNMLAASGHQVALPGIDTADFDAIRLLNEVDTIISEADRGSPDISAASASSSSSSYTTTAVPVASTREQEATPHGGPHSGVSAKRLLNKDSDTDEKKSSQKCDSRKCHKQRHPLHDAHPSTTTAYTTDSSVCHSCKRVAYGIMIPCHSCDKLIHKKCALGADSTLCSLCYDNVLADTGGRDVVAEEGAQHD